MRGMRGIGLVLVDERRRRVGVLVDVVGGADQAVGAGEVGGARQHHELLAGIGHLVAGAGNAVRTDRDQRIVRQQRDEHRAAAALGDQVEAVVEELAEEGEPAVERRRQAGVRRDVGDEQVAGRRRRPAGTPRCSAGIAGWRDRPAGPDRNPDWGPSVDRLIQIADRPASPPAAPRSAAGLLAVWSEIRLLIMRGAQSTTLTPNTGPGTVLAYVVVIVSPATPGFGSKIVPSTLTVTVWNNGVADAREHLVGGAERAPVRAPSCCRSRRPRASRTPDAD